MWLLTRDSSLSVQGFYWASALWARGPLPASCPHDWPCLSQLCCPGRKQMPPQAISHLDELGRCGRRPPPDRTVHEASRGRARTHAFRGNVQGPNSPGLRSQLSASQEGRGRKKFPELRKQSVLELRRAYPSVCTGLPARYRPRCGGLGRQLSPEPPGVSGCRPLGARPARGAPQAPSASSPQLRGLAPWPADSFQGESSR